MTAVGEVIKVGFEDNQCFGCSQERTDGLRMSFVRTGERSVECHCEVPATYRGIGRIVHGGIQAVLIDEAATVAAYLFWPENTYGVTADLQVGYKAPVPTETPIVVRGELVDENEKEFLASASISRADGKLLTTGTVRIRKLQVPSK